MSRKNTDKWKKIPYCDDLVAGDVIYLRGRESKQIMAGFIVKNNGLTIGDLCIASGAYGYYVSNWEHVAHVSLKWDSCTHWYFYGEDYEEHPTLNPMKPMNTNPNSYYHLCGSEYFLKHVTVMCFGWKLGQLLNHDENFYIDDPKIEKLAYTMLDGYEIDFSQISAFKKEKKNA